MKREQVWMKVADYLPKSLVYWAGIRMMVHATTGRYSLQEVPALTIMTALDRWERKDD